MIEWMDGVVVVGWCCCCGAIMDVDINIHVSALHFISPALVYTFYNALSFLVQ
jgi:hypothetical protein